MSMMNRHADMDLPAEDTVAIDTALTDIATRVAIYPTADDSVVRRVPRMGPQNSSFAREALQIASQHMELLPRGLDLARFGKTLKNYDALAQRYVRIALIANQIRTTMKLLGADAFRDGLDVYHALQRGTDASIRADVMRLARYFDRGAGESEEADEVVGEAPVEPAP